VTGLPRIENGDLTLGRAPGLGTALLPDVPSRPDAVVRRSPA